jgi:hypothetical protein
VGSALFSTNARTKNQPSTTTTQHAQQHTNLNELTKTQLHQPRNKPSTTQALDAPGEFLMSDFSKFDRPPLLHLAFRALDAFKVGR